MIFHFIFLSVLIFHDFFHFSCFFSVFSNVFAFFFFLSFFVFCVDRNRFPVVRNYF